MKIIDSRNLPSAVRGLALATLAAAMALALAACAPGQANTGASATPPLIPVASPEQRSIAITLDLPGHVEAVERVELRPRVGGYIERIAFAEGARVSKGQLLLQIDPAPYAAVLAGAEANLKQAAAELSLATAVAERTGRLAQRQAVSTEEAERRETQVAIATARRDSARAAVARAKLDLKYTQIVSPISGRIGRAEFTAGNLVKSDDRLAVIVADDRVYVRVDVAETLLSAQESAKWKARFLIPELLNQTFEGELAFLDNEISIGTGTLRARIALPGHPALVPGRYGQVQLILGQRENALLVDEKAIAADQGSRYVLVVGDDGTVQYRPVSIGARIGTQRVIEQGLAPQDRVVVAGLMGVRPGMTVTPQDVEALAAVATTPPASANSED